MPINAICKRCSEFNKTCSGMNLVYTGCIYFKKEEELKHEKYS